MHDFRKRAALKTNSKRVCLHIGLSTYTLIYIYIYIYTIYVTMYPTTLCQYCRPLNAETQLQFQPILCATCGCRAGTGIGFPPNSPVYSEQSCLPCQYHSTNLKYLFIYRRHHIMFGIHSAVNNAQNTQNTVSTLKPPNTLSTLESTEHTQYI
jgi:hypothetical protein